MRRKGMIIIVDDDADDIFIFKEIVQDLGIPNEVVSFTNAEECYSFLCTNAREVLIIFSDINMPGLNGIDFKRKINANPLIAKKRIPFIFNTTAASREAVREAFVTLNADGFFIKSPVYPEFSRLVTDILNYWSATRYLDWTD